MITRVYLYSPHTGVVGIVLHFTSALASNYPGTTTYVTLGEERELTLKIAFLRY